MLKRGPIVIVSLISLGAAASHALPTSVPGALSNVAAMGSGPALAGCVKNPTGETAIGFKNSSSLWLAFYIDTTKMATVPPGDRSIDFEVEPGERHLYAETVRLPKASLKKTVTIKSGEVCTWEITDN